MNGKIIQAWIFVRGDSLGLPGKNLRPLCGKPLIAYAIKAAKRCRFIRDVFVSTDSPTVAAAAGAGIDDEVLLPLAQNFGNRGIGLAVGGEAAGGEYVAVFDILRNGVVQ